MTTATLMLFVSVLAGIAATALIKKIRRRSGPRGPVHGAGSIKGVDKN